MRCGRGGCCWKGGRWRTCAPRRWGTRWSTPMSGTTRSLPRCPPARCCSWRRCATCSPKAASPGSTSPRARAGTSARWRAAGWRASTCCCCARRWPTGAHARRRQSPLDHRKPAPLGPRCRPRRGCRAQQKGPRPAKPRPRPKARPQPPQPHPDKGSIKGKIKRASWSNDFLLGLLAHMRFPCPYRGGMEAYCAPASFSSWSTCASIRRIVSSARTFTSVARV